MTKGVLWTQDEIDFLSSNYNKGRKFVAEALGFSICSVKHKAAQLGIKYQNQRGWTDKEDSYLIEHWRDDTAGEIGIILDRNPQVVHARAKKLCLKKGSIKHRNQFSNIVGNRELSEDRKSKSIDLYAPPSIVLEIPRFRCGKFRIPTILSPEGHILRSSGELVVEDYLHDNLIPHQYQPRDKAFSRYCPDWLIYDNLIVEFFGITSNYCDYETRKKKKIELFLSLTDYRFLALYPKDLKNLDDIFGAIREF